jgi:flagellar biosynthesis protein FlhF
MHLKRYRSTNVRDALSQARAELGSGALVLSTRLVPARGWRGWLGHRVVEVTAAANRDMSDTRPAPAETGPLATDAALVQAAPDVTLDTLVARLRAAGLDKALASEVVSALPRTRRRQASIALIRRTLADQLGTLAAGDDRLLAAEVFLGPPGVGKTTTIAKIAAQERARRGARLGLIAADGFRVGAVEQLRVYADVIGAPFSVARTPSELDAALKAVTTPVLVDTAGRSARDPQARELFDVLAGRTDVRTHVVLSAATATRDAARLLDLYAPVGPSRVALTRLDEAESIGPLVALLRERRLPLSYLCTGQRVPEDLVRATAPVLAAQLLEQEFVERGAHE